MSWKSRFSTHLTSYLVQFRPTSTIRRKKRKKVVVVQTSPIFRLPCELFQEILSYILLWPTAYYRMVYHMTWPPPNPGVFLEQARTMLALSATCRAMRQVVLIEAWKEYRMGRVTPMNKRRSRTRSLSECGILLRNPHLAAHVRTLVVRLIYETPRVTKLFVKCLTVLPNLHTLEIIPTWDLKRAKVLATALEKEKPYLQRVQTLALPPDAHPLLWYCPNLENLRCTCAPDERFIETLVASGLNHLTKFSIVHLRETGDFCLRVARAYPGIHELSGMLSEGWETTDFPELTQQISAFKNLSTIHLVYRLSKAPGHPDRRREPSDVWNALKGVAISQLEGSYTNGPKTLKTVLLWTGDDLKPKLMMEEIAV